jgi:hypothetical protein
MVQIIDQGPSGLSRFIQNASPGIDSLIDRLIEKRQSQSVADQRRAQARALGIDERVSDPALQGVMYKERAKDTRNQQLLEALGLSSSMESADMRSFEPGGLNNEKIALLGLVNPQIASLIQRQKEAEEKAKQSESKEQRRQFESERDYNTSLTKNIREEISGLQKALPKKESALNLAKEALETGDLGFFTRDKLADLTGIGAFRSAKGAQLITAGKENLLGNISRVTAKAANQWFEQRLNSMFPQIGQSREANETILEMLKGELAMDQAYLKEYEKQAAEDRAKYGYLREDIESRIRKAVEPQEKKILDRTSYRLRQIYEGEQGPEFLRKNAEKKVPRGTPLTVEMAQLLLDKYGDRAEAEAKKLGYTIPSEEIYMEFVE